MLRMGLLMLALCWSMPLYATLSLDLMDKLTESPENLRGQFVQKKTVKAFDVTIKSSGDFHYRRHQFIDWHTHKPVPNQLRMTPSQITSQQGDQSLMQIDTDADPTVKVLSQIFFAVLTAEWRQLADYFNARGDLQQQNWQLTLTPKTAQLEAIIKQVDLSGDQLLRDITLHEVNGDITHIHLSAER